FRRELKQTCVPRETFDAAQLAGSSVRDVGPTNAGLRHPNSRIRRAVDDDEVERAPEQPTAGGDVVDDQLGDVGVQGPGETDGTRKIGHDDDFNRCAWARWSRGDAARPQGREARCEAEAAQDLAPGNVRGIPPHSVLLFVPNQTL